MIDQKLVKTILLGTLSVATLAPMGYKAFADARAKVETKTEVPELTEASPTPKASPEAPRENREARFERPTGSPVESATPSPTPSPSASPTGSLGITGQTHFSVTGVGGGDDGIGEDDRLEVKTEVHGGDR